MQTQTSKPSPKSEAVSASSLARVGSVRKRRPSLEEDLAQRPAGRALPQRGRPKESLARAEVLREEASPTSSPPLGVGAAAGGGRAAASALIDRMEALLRTGMLEMSNFAIFGAVIVLILVPALAAVVYLAFIRKDSQGIPDVFRSPGDQAGNDEAEAPRRSPPSAHQERGGHSPSRRQFLQRAGAPREASPAKAGPSSAALTQLPPPAPGAHLCSDLVVPSNCECVLVVPLLPIGPEPFEITDALGKSVLFVGLAPDAGPSKPRFMLTTGDGTTLARCAPADGHASPNAAKTEFVLMRGQGDVFATFKRTDDQQESYVLRTRNDVRLHFCGAFHRRAVNVLDDEGRLLAATKPSAEKSIASQEPKSHQQYILRVAPLTDVGLVLCGLLCIDSIKQCC